MLKPTQDRVLVRPKVQEEKTRGGIYIPRTAESQDQATEGEVLAVGPGYPLPNGKVHPIDLQVGDRVLFGKFAPVKVVVDGEELILVREEEVLGVLVGS